MDAGEVDERSGELLALAGVALAHESLPDALQEICQIAARAVRNADGATMTTFSAEGPTVAAASSEWAGQLDELQHVEREGPCIDAARTGALFRVRDLRSEQRWPSYTPRACERGASSMLSLPMTVEAKVIGALNVYSRHVDAFAAEDVSIAEVIAGHASLATQVAAAMQNHKDAAAHLRVALASRGPIDQAKGIIMATVGCGPDAAFQRLVEQSQFENRKVREIADELVHRYDRR